MKGVAIVLGCLMLAGCEMVYFVREEPPRERAPAGSGEEARTGEKDSDDMLERGERVSSERPRPSADAEPEYRVVYRWTIYHPGPFCTCSYCLDHYHSYWESWWGHWHSYPYPHRSHWSFCWGW